VGEALRQPSVVQLRVPLGYEDFPVVLPGGGFAVQPRLVDFDPFIFDGHYAGGCLTRLSAGGLLNVTALEWGRTTLAAQGFRSGAVAAVPAQPFASQCQLLCALPGGGTRPYSQRAVSGRLMRMLSMRAPGVARPNLVPRSCTRLNST
jgi:hypothetical protein